MEGTRGGDGEHSQWGHRAHGYLRRVVGPATWAETPSLAHCTDTDNRPYSSLLPVITAGAAQYILVGCTSTPYLVILNA